MPGSSSGELGGSLPQLQSTSEPSRLGRNGQDREAPGSKITGRPSAYRCTTRNIEDFSGLEGVVDIVEVHA